MTPLYVTVTSLSSNALDHATGFAVDRQQVVGKIEAGVQWELADDDVDKCMAVGVRHIADVPARMHKQCVDADFGFLLWGDGLVATLE